MKVSSMKNLKRMMVVLCAVALVVTSFGGFGSVYADTNTKPAVVADYSDVPEKYKPAMKQAVEMGLLTPGKDGKLRPNDIMTVAEYATVWWKLHGKWFTAKDADYTNSIYGRLEINNKDAKKHWAYVPMSFGRYAGSILLSKDDPPKVVDQKTLFEKSNISSNMVVRECNLYLLYGSHTINLMFSDEYKTGRADFLVDGKYNNRESVIRFYQKKSSLKGSLPPYISNSERHVLDTTCLHGIQVFQSAGLLPLNYEEKPIVDLAREITRAEAVYTMLYMESFLKDRGFAEIYDRQDYNYVMNIVKIDAGQ